MNARPAFLTAAPTLTASGTDLIGFACDDDGLVRGYVVGKAMA